MGKLLQIFIGMVFVLGTAQATSTIYEDAENGNTAGWSVYDKTPAGAKITNVYDSKKQSKVIKLTGDRYRNGYMLGNIEGSAGAWANTKDYKIKWSMNYSEDYSIYVRVLTKKGPKYLYYTPLNKSLGKRGSSYIHIGLGHESRDGTWRTITRDLRADLKKFEPDNELLAVNAFLIRGSGLVDDIGLSGDGVVTPPADTVAPVITLNGSSSVSLVVGAVYSEKGATALDNKDGVVAVTTSGAVDTSKAGTYTVTYTATDKAGNSATKTRTVVVTLAPDTTVPVITLNGEATVSIIVGSSYTDAGATAADDRDGVVTVVTSGAVDSSKVGTYIVTYTAVDKAGNSVTATRTVTVTEVPNHAPKAKSETSNIMEDSSVEFSDYGSDEDNDPLVYTITAAPTHGKVLVKNGSTLVYAPNKDYNGNDSFSYKVNDGKVDSNIGTITVVVAGVNDAPVIDRSGYGNMFIDHNISKIQMPVDAYVVDIDKDNDNDFLITLNNKKILQLYINNGDEYSEHNITLSTPAFRVSAADYDGDGDLDLSISTNDSGASGVKWIENLGNYVFKEHNITASTGYTDALSVKSGDMDGDGDQDIVYAISSRITWEENDGTGHFKDHNISLNTQTLSYNIDLADMDNDGDLDMLVEAKWYENNGKGVFTEHNITTPKLDIMYDASYASDIDGDGDLDVLYGYGSNNGDAKTVWYENKGENTFVEHIIDDTQGSIMTKSVDIDSDGDLDIVSSTYGHNQDSHVIYINDGNQNFTKTILTNDIGYMDIIDFDHDGDSDILVSKYNKGFVIWIENKNNSSVSILEGKQDVGTIQATDVDGDTLVYSISGEDAASFTVDSSSGKIRFKETTSYLNPSDTDKDNQYNIVLQVSDGKKSDTADITVIVNEDKEKDVTAPVITLNGQSTVRIEVGSDYSEEGAVATDNKDETVTIVTTGTVDTTTVGTYTITYTATDKAGNSASKSRTVIVTLAPDTKAPVITLSGAATVSLKTGETYTEAGATAVDDRDGVVTVSTSGAVDTSKVGTYTITYTATDKAGNSATKTRTVVVTLAPDTTVPVITLKGAAVVNLKIGETYTDKGATATDDRDGDITANIVVTSNVDTSKAGTYSVKYNVIDGATNRAVEVVRVVNVNDYEVLTKKLPLVPAHCKGNIEKSGKDLNGNGILDDAEVTSTFENYEEGTPLTRVALKHMILDGKDVTSVNTCKITDMSKLVTLYDYDDKNLTQEQKDNIANFNQDISGWNTAGVIDMSYMFLGLKNFNQPLDNWDTSKVTNMSYMFAGALKFDQALENWDTSHVEDMSFMFLSSRKFNQPLGGWDTSSVTNMNYMFASTDSFNGTVGAWDTSKVTDMSYMFSRADSFNQPLAEWNTSSVTTMAQMFSGADLFNRAIGNWDTSKVTDMSYMFYGTKKFSQPLSQWDTGSVVTMEQMFFGSQFNSDIANWNTSKVVSMRNMFHSTDSFNQPIGDWDTSSVTDMYSMFGYAKKFNQPIGNWNTSKVIDMSSMFFSAESFNQPLNSWDVSSVTDMQWMFGYAYAFNQPLGNWNTENVSNMGYLFRDARRFDQDISNWEVAQVGKYMHSLFAKGSRLTDEHNPFVDHTDRVAPVITLNGTATMDLNVGDVYVEAGATATDDRDGTVAVSISGTVDTTQVGVYTVTYTASDKTGNSATKTRTVNVKVAPDTMAPIITLNGDELIKVFVDTEFTDPGAVAVDDKDGEVTVSVTGNVDIHTVKKYLLTYTAEDKAGNKASKTRTVSVESAPVWLYEMTGGKTITIEQGAAFVDPGVKFLNTENSFNTYTTSGTVNTDKPGTYTLTYAAVFYGYTATATRTVIVKVVEDTTKPVITLIGSNSINVYIGSAYQDAGATAADNKDGDITGNIVVTGSVDTSKIGTYTIKYSVSDQATNEANVIERSVHVVDHETLSKRGHLSPATCKGYIEKSGKDLNNNGVLEDNEVATSNEVYEK